ncbi:MAG TPA: metallophosphoesterase [Candidatus Hypogeohydataceae bacterium YC40]
MRPSSIPIEIKKALVLSDLHIGWEESTVERLLDKWPEGYSEVILVGDVVDLWRNKKLEDVGQQEVQKLYKELCKKLEGKKVHYVIGNHDYHILRTLQGEPATKRLTEFLENVRENNTKFYHPVFQFKSGGETFCCTHGDNFNFLYWYEMFRPEIERTEFKPSMTYDDYEVVYEDNMIAHDWDEGRILRLIWHFFKVRLMGRVLGLTIAEREPIEEKIRDKISDVEKYWEQKYKIKVKWGDICETIHNPYLDLGNVYKKRFPNSLKWKKEAKDAGIIYYHPFPNELPHPEEVKADPSVLIVGHFHYPRKYPVNSPVNSYEVYDIGAFAEGPLGPTATYAGGHLGPIATYLTIDNGTVKQHKLN